MVLKESTCLQEESTKPDLDNENVSQEEKSVNETILDWKGDPMQVNPGDRLPFNF